MKEVEKEVEKEERETAPNGKLAQPNPQVQSCFSVCVEVGHLHVPELCNCQFLIHTDSLPQTVHRAKATRVSQYSTVCSAFGTESTRD